MRIQHDPKRVSFHAPALAVVCLLFALSMSACGSSSSTGVIFIPSDVLAQFAVFQNTTNTATGPVVENYAGAIFYRGITTQTVTGGSVSVVDPGGIEHVMAVMFNPAGAPYYLTTMPAITLGGRYLFRVTLEDGTRLEGSITAPTQALQVTVPQQAATLALNDYLQVQWTGTGSTNAAIVLRRPSTQEIFSVIGLGRIQAPDTGSFDGSTRNPPVIVVDAREAGDTGTGPRIMTVTRNNTVSVGGFFAGSCVQASLIYGQDVNLVP